MRYGSSPHCVVSTFVAIAYVGSLTSGCNGPRRDGSTGDEPAEAQEQSALSAPVFHPLLDIGPNGMLGPTPSSFNVTASGEATWEMPVWIPEGRNNVAPRLTITYGSKRGSSILGKGFAVSGLSTISRCWRTQATDGAYTPFGVVGPNQNIDPNPPGVPDAFCLDGERLVPRASSPGELQPENDPSTTVRFSAGSGSSFEVLHADGQVWQFGSRNTDPIDPSQSTVEGKSFVVTGATDPATGALTQDNFAQTPGADRTMAWNLDRVLDRWGNFYDIDYERTSDPQGAIEVVPKRISWTGHVDNPNQAPQAPTRTLEFEYRTDPKSDPRTSYRGGLAVRDSRLLNRIKISGPDRLVSDPAASTATGVFREYYFGYLPADPAGLAPDRLQSIQECVPNHSGQDVCKNPVFFSWSDHAAPSFKNADVLPGVDLPGISNGVGIPSTFCLALQNDSDARGDALQADVLDSAVGDFDGDGRDDLLYRLPKLTPNGTPAFADNAATPQAVIGIWFVRRGTPAGLGAREVVTGIPDTPGGDWRFSARPIDIDSDGRAEVLAYSEPVPSEDPAGNGSTGYDVYRLGACAGGTCTFAPVSIGESGPANQIQILPVYPRRSAGLEMGDLNADGVVDLVRNPLKCDTNISGPTLCPSPLPFAPFDPLLERLGIRVGATQSFQSTSVVGTLMTHRAEARHVVDVDGNGVPELLMDTYNVVPNDATHPAPASLSAVSFAPDGTIAASVPVMLHARPLEQSNFVSRSCSVSCDSDLDTCHVLMDPQCGHVQGTVPCGTTASARPIFLTQFARFFADLNGDGLADAVSVPSDYADGCPTTTYHDSELYVSMNLGGQFQPPVRQQQTDHDGFNPSLDRDDSRTPIGPVVPQGPSNLLLPPVQGRAVDPGARFVDLDGDGRQDIIQLSRHVANPKALETGDCDPQARTAVVWLRSTDTGFQSSELSASTPVGTIPAAPQRFLRLGTTTGNDNTLVAGGYGARMSQVGDFNGDGTPDIVTLVRNPPNINPGDANLWASLHQYLGNPVSPDVVTRIDGGPLVPAIDVTYAYAGPNNDTIQYDVSGSCDFGQICLRKMGWVVEHYSIEAGCFDPASDPACAQQPITRNTYRFSYDTARIDLRGRGFLGVDARTTLLTADGPTQVFEARKETFDHLTRVFQSDQRRFQYANSGNPVRQIAVVGVDPRTFLARVSETTAATALLPRSGGFGFDLNQVSTAQDVCDVLVPSLTDALGSGCGTPGATLITSRSSARAFDGFGNFIRHEDRVALSGSYLASTASQQLSTIWQLTGTNNADTSRWLVSRWSGWSFQSADETQLSPADQNVFQNGSIDYFTNQVETKDIMLERFSAAETPSTSGFIHTTTYERDPRFGVVTAVSECGTIAPCDPTTSRRATFGFHSNDSDKIFYATVTNALQQRSSIWPHATLGVPYAVDSADGTRTQLTYDTLGRTRSVQWPGGAAEGFDYSFDLSPAGAVKRSWTVSHTGPAIADVAETFNPRGLIIGEVREGFDHQTGRTWSYDRFGRLSSESLPFSALMPPRPTVPSIEYTRDGLGRVKQVSRPGESAQAPRFVSTRSYFDRTETRTSESCSFPSASCLGVRGAVSTIERDAKGRVISMSDSGGGAPVATQIAYWHFDRPSRVTHPLLPAGQVGMTPPDSLQPATSIFYDDLGRRIELDDPDVGKQTYLYNSFGEMKQLTDGASSVTKYQHDLLGRLTNIHTDATPYVARGPAGAQDTTFTYDKAPNAKLTLFATGKLTRVDSIDGITRQYSYDASGRMHIETVRDNTSTDPTWQLRYQYDTLGRLDTLTYPESGTNPFAVQYDYAANGEITNIWNASSPGALAPLWKQISRNDADESTLEQFGSTEVVDRVYDAAFNLRFIEGKFLAVGPRTSERAFQRLHFDWGADNLLVDRTDIDLGITEEYTHDFLSRLTQWKVTQGCGTIAWQYDYDDWGNLRKRSAPGTTIPSTTYDYAVAGEADRPHAIKQVTTAGQPAEAYSYDLAGQVLAGRENAFKWTPIGLPFQVTNGQRQSHYLYDGFGRRVVENQGPVGGTPDKRIVTFSGLFEYRSSGGLPSAYTYNVFNGDGLVAQVRRQPSGSLESVNFVHPDHLGSPDAVTTVATVSAAPFGKLVERNKYEPFGEYRQTSSIAQPTARLHAADDSVGFTGHQPDDVFGLINMKGRLYDPSSTRFISGDPLASPHSQGLNRYSYVKNSPVALVDPSGFGDEQRSDAWPGPQPWNPGPDAPDAIVPPPRGASPSPPTAPGGPTPPLAPVPQGGNVPNGTPSGTVDEGTPSSTPRPGAPGGVPSDMEDTQKIRLDQSQEKDLLQTLLRVTSMGVLTFLIIHGETQPAGSSDVDPWHDPPLDDYVRQLPGRSRPSIREPLTCPVPPIFQFPLREPNQSIQPRSGQIDPSSPSPLGDLSAGPRPFVKPPTYPGDDPTKAPGPSWTWRGKPPAGGDWGAWYNPTTGESLKPDLTHPPPITPHWDYTDPYGTSYRIFPDGHSEPK